MVEEIRHAETLVAEIDALGHCPVNGIRIAEHVNGIVAFGAEQGFEPFLGNGDQITLPGTDNLLVGEGGIATECAQFIAKLRDVALAALQLGEKTRLSVGADVGTQVKTQFRKGADAAFLVQIYENTAKIE